MPHADRQTLTRPRSPCPTGSHGPAGRSTVRDGAWPAEACTSRVAGGCLPVLRAVSMGRPAGPGGMSQAPRLLADDPVGWLEESRLAIERASDRARILADEQAVRTVRAVMERIERVRGYVEFRLLLGLQGVARDRVPVVTDFPPGPRAVLLAGLGGRLMALPCPERALAIRDFLAVDPGLEVTPLLRDLRAAACRGTEGLRLRELSLVGPAGAACEAVQNGAHVRVAARQFALAGEEALDRLEAVAWAVACRAVAAGTNVPVVANAMGIVNPARREDLERVATGHVGIAAVRSGECPIAVAQRLGIGSQRCVQVLKHHAARRLVKSGHGVPGVVRAFDVRHEGAILGLEMLAADAAVDLASGRGEDALRIAMRWGVTRPFLLDRVERRAALAVRVGATCRVPTPST